MAINSFRTRTTQPQQTPPPPSSRQWFRLSTLSLGNSATTAATLRPPTSQDQKPSGHVDLPTESGRSTPLLTSPEVSKPKISLVTLSPPLATTTSLPLSSPSPSLPPSSPGRATTVKESKANTTPSPSPIPKPISESRVILSPPSPKPNKKNNEPQAPYSSPSKVLSSPRTPPKQHPILPNKFNTDRKRYTSTATAAAVSVDEKENMFISLTGENRGAVFVDVVASPGKHRSSRNSSSDDERRHHEYTKNERPASLGGLGAFANSNVQGVNNSLLFNSSFLHHDPGVHIINYDTVADTITSSAK